MALKQIVASGANQRSQKYGGAADWLESGFNPPNNMADKCPQPVDFYTPSKKR